MKRDSMEYQEGREKPVTRRKTQKAHKGPSNTPASKLSRPEAAKRAKTKVQEARQLVNGTNHPAKVELFDLLWDAEMYINMALDVTAPKGTPIRLPEKQLTNRES